MKNGSSIGVALIGAGYTAKEHARAFRDIGNVELKGVFSRTRVRAEALAEDHGIALIAGSLEELWDRTRAEVVVVTVNEPGMAETIEACCVHDWKVLAEKPPALSVEEAENLEGLARSKKRDVRIALNRASYSVTRKVSEEIEPISGRRVVIVQDQQDPERALSLGRPNEVVDRWMYANSIHLMDYFRIFCRGSAARVETTGGVAGDKPAVIMARMEFESGDIGIYQAFWNEPAPWACSVHLPDVRYELRPLEEGKRQHRLKPAEDLPVHEWDRAFKPGYRRQAEEMTKLAATGAGEVPTLSDAIKTMKLIKSVYGV